MKLGEVQLAGPYKPGGVAGIQVNNLSAILRDLDVVPSRVTVYDKSNLDVHTTYLIATIGGSHIFFNGVIAGVDQAYRQGDPVSLQISLDDAPMAFVAPSFASFDISGQSTPLEVGATIAAGSKTFEWVTVHPTSVKPNSISIVDTTASMTLASGLADDGSEAITIAAITLVLPGSQVWTINGVDVQNGTFSLTFEVDWEWRVYTGTSANVTLTANQIKALSDSSSLQASFPGTYNYADSLGYKYFCYPDSMGSVASFIYVNFPVSMATVSDNAAYSHTANGWSYALVSVTNAQGVATNYRVYRTQFAFSGTFYMVIT